MVVTRNLPPLVGGMERLNRHLIDELSRLASVHVVGPAGAATHLPPDVPVDTVPVTPLWRFLLAATWRVLLNVRACAPDLVVGGSGLVAPIVWLAARLAGARSVIYVHGLDIVVDNRIYRRIWLPFIRRSDVVIANSRATAGLARSSGVSAGRIVVIHPGVDLPAAEPTDTEIASFRQRHRLGPGPILLSVGRLTARKGIREFVADVLPAIVARHPDAVLVVIGHAPADALAAREQSQRSIQQAAETVGVGDNLRFLGKVDEMELQLAFAAAAVHVFPVRELQNDPEGFGMVAMEAAARGVPTVAYAVGGVPDAVLEPRTGSLLAQGNTTGFAKAVDAWIRAGRDEEWRRRCVDTARQFSWPMFGARLRDVLDTCPSEAG